MYKVNLIRGWQKTELYRLYRQRFLLAIGVVSALSVFVYLGFFIYFLLLQKQLSTLSSKQLTSSSGQTYSTEELTKTLYSLKKLDQIKEIFASYPEYALYHQFLLDNIFEFSSFTIDNYALDRHHSVEAVLSTKSLEDIFALISLLESDKVSQYFSVLEINNISSSLQKDEVSHQYRVGFTLQFNDKLLNEKT